MVRRGVKAILQYVEIKAAKFLGAIELQLPHDLMELVLAVARAHVLEIGVGNAQLVAVQLQQFGRGHSVSPRVEIRRVGEKEAQRVANAPIAFDDTLEDLVGNRKIAGIVGRADPQSKHLGTESAPHLLRRYDVALGLRHFLAMPIYREPMREERLVRRHTIEHGRSQQRRMEPAAMLIRSLEVEIGRKACY